MRTHFHESGKVIDSGKEAFGFYCVACHGRDGQNTGVPFANSISPPIPSLASFEVQRYSDGQLKVDYRKWNRSFRDARLKRHPE